MVVGLLRGRAEIVQLCVVGGVYLGGGDREWLVGEVVMVEVWGEVDGGVQDVFCLPIGGNWQNCLECCEADLVCLLENYQGEL